jgi:hypothetical protein
MDRIDYLAAEASKSLCNIPHLHKRDHSTCTPLEVNDMEILLIQ